MAFCAETTLFRPATKWQPTLGAWIERGGTAFRVWAPNADRVDVVFPCDRGRGAHPLEPQQDGVHAGWIAGVEPGTRYMYRIAVDSAPLPDPASRFQPDRVHGPSEVIDPSTFEWSDGAWMGLPLEDMILYELHVGAFTGAGTFAGVERRLDYLRHLGVTAIELMPLGDFDGRWNWATTASISSRPRARTADPTICGGSSMARMPAASR